MQFLRPWKVCDALTHAHSKIAFTCFSRTVSSNTIEYIFETETEARELYIYIWFSQSEKLNNGLIVAHTVLSKYICSSNTAITLTFDSPLCIYLLFTATK